jgi:hypothetical protein
MSEYNLTNKQRCDLHASVFEYMFHQYSSAQIIELVKWNLRNNPDGIQEMFNIRYLRVSKTEEFIDYPESFIPYEIVIWAPWGSGVISIYITSEKLMFVPADDEIPTSILEPLKFKE